MEMGKSQKEIAIRLSGIKKQYRLGQIGGGTLQADLQSWWAKIRGKEDPNSKIGQKEQLVGDSFMALNGINLTICKGEAVGIIGANGAGKSTMLKLLSRVTAPTEGEIEIYGRISSMLEIGTGFHSQMTGRENIYLNGSLLGMSESEIDKKLASIIEFSEVSDFIDTPVKRYSSGMFVKLAFAVAAHLDSEILIMDEVLAVGDMDFQKKCLNKMNAMAKEENRTILYVSHNMNTIRELCGRCVVLDKGKVIYDGDVETAISVYMNHSLQNDQVDIDLTLIPHAGKGEQTELSMTRLLLLDKVVALYDNTENLRLCITVDLRESLRNVLFRLTFRTDSDQGIGTAWSKPFDLQKGANQKLYFEVPLSLLAKGIFYISLGFYIQKKDGTRRRLDHLSRAFRIELKQKSGVGYWFNSAYGPVQFPDPIITIDKMEGSESHDNASYVLL